MNRRDSKIERLIPLQIGSVKKILFKKHGLTFGNDSDRFLERCLRIKDGNIEKTVKLVLTYQNSITQVVEWGASVKPSMYQSFFDKGALSILRERDMLGRRVCIVRTKFWDPEETSFEAAITALWMATEHLISEFQDTQADGYVSIWDFTDFTWQQFWAVNQWRLLTAARMGQNGVAGRVGALHTIFHPKAIGILYSGIRPFLKEKLRKRIFFHESVESLHNHVSPKILPDFLGGMLTLEEAADTSVVNELLKKDKHFEELIATGFPTK